MGDISLSKKLDVIFSLIGSESFFLTLFIILVATVVMLIINNRVQSKAPKIIAVILYIGMIVLVFLRYGKYIASLNDNLVEKVFKAVYFPNVVVYTCMLIISVILILITFIDKRFSNITKISNVSCFCVIWFLFVLVLDTVKRSNVNFYDMKEVYSNVTVMVLLQTSMYVFVIWLLIFLMDFIVRKLSGEKK